jgi:hypothetical protein
MYYDNDTICDVVHLTSPVVEMSLERLTSDVGARQE